MNHENNDTFFNCCFFVYAAKEKTKELKKEFKSKFNLKFKYDYCEDWHLGLKYGKFWTETPTVFPPELINEFSKDNIRYKVYKDAECGPGPPTIGFDCYEILDTLRPTAIWTTREHLPGKICTGGNGFCVEQEVVVLLEREYSDDSCTHLINIRQIKGFSCFD